MQGRTEDEPSTPVSIPTALARKIEQRIKGTPFPSVSAYVTYVLTEVLSGTEEDSEGTFSKEDEERVKARLRALGYLD